MRFYDSLSGTPDYEARMELARYYHLFHRDMYHIVYHMLGEKQMAEDAVQESFARVIQYRAYPKFKTETLTRIRGYFIVVCKNIALEMMRQRQTPDLDEDSLVDMEDPNPEPIERLINEENLQRIVSKIAALDEIFRGVFFLKFAHHIDNKTIANLLHITEDNVRKRIERGKKQLLKLLQEEA